MPSPLYRPEINCRVYTTRSLEFRLTELERIDLNSTVPNEGRTGEIRAIRVALLSRPDATVRQTRPAKRLALAA